MAGPKAHALMKSGGVEPPWNYTRSQSVMRQNDNEVLITMYTLSYSVNNVLNLTYDILSYSVNNVLNLTFDKVTWAISATLWPFGVTRKINTRLLLNRRSFVGIHVSLLLFALLTYSKVEEIRNLNLEASTRYKWRTTGIFLKFDTLRIWTVTL